GLVLAATLVVGVAGAATLTTWLRPRPVPVTPEAPPPAESPAPSPRAGTAPPPAATHEEPPAAASSAPPPPRAGAPQARPQPQPVEDLLLQANDLRASRRWREAARTYERVLAVNPASPEAYAAAVAAAELRLEQLNDPAAALRLYRTALQKNPQ